MFKITDYANGQTLVVEHQLIGVSTTASTSTDAKKAGKYPVTVLPDSKGIMGTNVYLMTSKQLSRMADASGLSSWRTLPPLVAMGEAKLIVTVEVCREGEPIPGRGGEVYQKDWLRTRSFTVVLGDAGQNRLDTIVRDIAVQSELQAQREESATSRANRIAAAVLAATGNNNNVVVFHDDDDADADTDADGDDDSTDGDDVIAAAAITAVAKPPKNGQKAGQK